MGQTVGTTDFYGACAVRAVVHNKDLFSGRKQTVQNNVNIDRAGAAEQNTGILLQVAVNNPDKVLPQALHQPGKLLLSGADIWHNLGKFHAVRGG